MKMDLLPVLGFSPFITMGRYVQDWRNKQKQQIGTQTISNLVFFCQEKNMFEGENTENGWVFYAFEGSFSEIKATDRLKVILTGFFITKAVVFSLWN